MCTPLVLHALNALFCTGQRSMHGPRVCILGGGFGGLYTALRLDSLLWPQGSKPQVTLIDRSSRFVFKPLLYELLNGGATQDEVAPPFSQLLAPYSINFIQVSTVPLQTASLSCRTLEDGINCLVDNLVVLDGHLKGPL